MENKNRRNNVDGSHPKHPVRNFFYVIWSLFNILCFVGFFYALYAPTLSVRWLVLIATGGVCVLAFVFGVFRPLAATRRR